MSTYKQILIAIDFRSVENAMIIERAKSLATGGSESQIAIIHVLEPITGPYTLDASMT